MVYESFILKLLYMHCTLTLVLVLRKLKLKYGLVSNHWLQATREHTDWKEPQGNDKLE